ncbi:MAG: CopG family transcriptional regulator [Caldilinea sp. CFX5]|nr:CopG family transcriptional regulator [Caldilinea sp. CFX5]
MKNIQVALDEPLLEDVDEVVTQLHTTRSAFVRNVLQAVVQRFRIRVMEQRQIDAYRRQPQTDEEFTDWLAGQEWGDEWNVIGSEADATR